MSENMKPNAQDEKIAEEIYDRLSVVQFEAISGNDAKKDIAIIAEAIQKARSEGRKEIEKELMAELRDPNGTIWEHAKWLQDENDRLKAEIKAIRNLK